MQRQLGNDALEAFISAESNGTHVYGYDTSGRIITDTWTINGSVYVKTYTYNTSGALTGESDWVKQ